MNKQQLANKIWASANKMRSKIEANEYKDYILGFIFYKFLSEQEVRFAKEGGATDEDLPNCLNEDDAEMVSWIQGRLGYFISYKNLYSTWISKDFDFQIINVSDALSAFTRLISPSHKKVFRGIFDTLSTGLKKLGTTDAEQTRAVSELLLLIKDIPMGGRQDYDVLGFIYEYLISQFAANAGKKAGEFYTPHEVSVLMSEIVAYHLKEREHIEIYDPTSGSGSLLINIGKSLARHLQTEDSVKYYAQELKQNTYNLTRMNLVMRGIVPDNIVTRNGDTLKDDWPWFDDSDKENTYEPLHVDAVVSNPPYSQSWVPPRKPKNGLGGEIDPRFENYGIAPKGKADYAFLLHDLYHLKADGIMTIVLPHGVLFRGDAGDGTSDNMGDGSEGSIRRNLIENNHIDAIIGLPADIFFGTGIPTIVMVLRKQQPDRGVLIIDASKGFQKEGKKNKLRASDIRRIVDTYINREDVPRFARVVSKDEIRRNGYNLNIPRYVNSSDDAETWNLHATMFGGLPKDELQGLDAYWQAFPGLCGTLFEPTDTPYTHFVAADIAASVKSHSSVKGFIQDFHTAFGDFGEVLLHRLIDGMETLNIAAEEEAITKDIFHRLGSTPLLDRFDAYQLFADKWEQIAVDLEIIQTEGFKATTVVDPNMVVKKKDDRDYEVQEGWVGHVLPFELVQTTYLREEWQALRDKERRQEETNAETDSTLAEMADDEREGITNDDGTLAPKEVEVKLAEALADVETEETELLRAYLALSKKKDKLEYIAAHTETDWSVMTAGKDGTYGKTAVNARIAELRMEYPFPEGSYEARLRTLSRLIAESKNLRSAIKHDSAALHEHTKDFIENHLGKEDVLKLLRMKWIDSLTEHLLTLPDTAVCEFVARLVALQKKYATTLVDVEKDIREASAELAVMLDELTGSQFDIDALQELKKLLVNV